jgi:hypothetical protein
MIARMGSRGIQRRKPFRRLRRLKGDAHTIDEPPVMWSPPGSGFEASPLSPAGYVQNWWRLTGRGSDLNEEEALRRRKTRPGRVGAFILRLLGYRRRTKATDHGSAKAHNTDNVQQDHGA